MGIPCETHCIQEMLLRYQTLCRNIREMQLLLYLVIFYSKWNKIIIKDFLQNRQTCRFSPIFFQHVFSTASNGYQRRNSLACGISSNCWKKMRENRNSYFCKKSLNKIVLNLGRKSQDTKKNLSPKFLQDDEYDDKTWSGCWCAQERVWMFLMTCEPLNGKAGII